MYGMACTCGMGYCPDIGVVLTALCLHSNLPVILMADQQIAVWGWEWCVCVVAVVGCVCVVGGGGGGGGAHSCGCHCVTHSLCLHPVILSTHEQM